MAKFNELPVEIQERMLDEQERQGNPRNVEVFEADILADTADGGFLWKESVDGYDFWDKIVFSGDFTEFYKKYPKS